MSDHWGGSIGKVNATERSTKSTFLHLWRGFQRGVLRELVRHGGLLSSSNIQNRSGLSKSSVRLGLISLERSGIVTTEGSQFTKLHRFNQAHSLSPQIAIRSCARGPRCRLDYQARISRPLLDRIDIRIDVPSVSATDLIRPHASESIASVAERVARAPAAQKRRFEQLGFPSITTNAQCSVALIEQVSQLDSPGLSPLQQASEQIRFSARLPSGAEGCANARRSRRAGDRRPAPGRVDLLSHGG